MGSVQGEKIYVEMTSEIFESNKFTSRTDR